ncbi:hypothetical protein TNCV_1403841 [Trichonephila clavipes]|nr:hypothetical protein TNCV_1403841 [Trichonephila clavipes]
MAEGNTRAAERLYRERYQQRDAPVSRMFVNLYPICVNMDHLPECGRYRNHLNLLPCNDPYSHKLRYKLAYIRLFGASLCEYLLRYNLSAASAFPSVNP